MSLESLAQQVVDGHFCARVEACAMQEAYDGAGAGTPLGDALVAGTAYAIAIFRWPCAFNSEADYESALAAGDERPDLNVSDAEILAAVQASWPTPAVEPLGAPT
jgi:hypothetical protein